MLKVLELFAGTRCISKAFERQGFETYSVEWNKKFTEIDLYDDVNNVTVEIVKKLCNGLPDVIWASPDCTTYSIAGIPHHRRKNLITNSLDPISEYAKFCDKTNQHVVNLIKEINPKLYFIENPRGGLRKMDFMKGLPRYTVTYCQYGFEYMKPTDIWTNHPNPKFKPPCKNGSPCHVSCPRGSSNGLQGISGSANRSKIPDELCKHIVEITREFILS